MRIGRISIGGARASRALAAAIGLLLSLPGACTEHEKTTDGDGPPPSSGATLELIASGLDFPLYLTTPPGDPRLFIVEKTGRIRIIESGKLLPEPFLDLSAQVSNGSEQGLLSMAFHPRYAENGRFFVDFTNTEGDTRVVEYRVSAADPDRAGPAPVTTILAVDQPYSNHNGGLVLFGPDGKFYVGLGDGGSAGDPQGNGQSLSTLLGKILRLDVDAGSPYAIPPDNPFVGDPGVREEIWAYGLRNPWRFSFDRANGDLYIADVGQWDYEEVDAVAASGLGGQNYGWNVMEGAHCFKPSTGCDQTGLALPVVEYDHSGANCSVTGGYVYRGSALPDLAGCYFYADYCSGFVRSFKLAGGRASEERAWPGLEPPGSLVASFGEDSAGELYILSGSGTVHKIVPK